MKNEFATVPVPVHDSAFDGRYLYAGQTKYIGGMTVCPGPRRFRTGRAGLAQPKRWKQGMQFTVMMTMSPGLMKNETELDYIITHSLKDETDSDTNGNFHKHHPLYPTVVTY